MLVLCITGGIGSGKSSVSRMFADKGAHVIELDDVARSILEPGQPAAVEVASLWPEVVRDGALNRARLASIVFSDPQQLAKLNAITHPRTWEKAQASIAQIGTSEPDAVVLVESAIIAGGSHQDFFHGNILVEAEETVRIERLVEQRSMAESDVRARLGNQRPAEALRTIADVVVDNSGQTHQTRAIVDELWETWVVPYAVNIFSGARLMGDDGEPTLAQRGRLMARLRAHGVESRARDEAVVVLTEDLSEEQMTAAGCVRGGDPTQINGTGFVGADPAYAIELVR